MSEIIQKWLSGRLGIILDLNLLSFGEITKDGQLIAQLLCNYGILNTEEVEKFCKTDNFECALYNLLNLNKYLKQIGIDYANKKLEDIARGDGMTSLRLFYQLYLILNNKNKLYFVTSQTIKEKSQVKISSNATESELSNAQKSQSTANPDLDSAKAVIKWHKNNYLEQYFKCKEIREQYLQQFEEKIRERHVSILEKKETVEKLPAISDLTETTDTDIKILKCTLADYVKKCSCEPDMREAKKFVLKLKEKTEKFIAEKKLQSFMHKLFLNNLLETLMEKQRKVYGQSVSKKLMKQSYYEKQIETKLLEVRNQRDTIIYNRNLENEYLAKKKDDEFMSQLYQQRHNISLANLKNENERRRILDLHKKLYNEKCERKYKKHYNICNKIVNDFVDLSMKSVEYKKNYNVDVPERVWKEWVAAFCAEQEIFDNVKNIDDIINEDNLEADTDALSLELYRQEALDVKDMDDYLQSDWPWNLDEMCTLLQGSLDFIKLGQNVLGFIVHKLLKKKYPLPLPPHPSILPFVSTAASVVGNNDESLIYILDKLLSKKKIVVLNMHSAINYCLNAYVKEVGPIKEVSNKEDNKGKKGKDKKGKKKPEIVKKGEKSKTKDKQEKADASGKEMFPKETQTPKLFPGEELQLSSPAVLGQFAYETFKSGLPLNEYLTASMFAEYLKTFKKIKGWVLMNYPLTIEGAIYLEYALTGRPITYNNQDNESIDGECDSLEYLREELFGVIEDDYEDKRISKLVPNISEFTQEKKQKSYLSSFVYLTPPIEALPDKEENVDYMQTFMPLANFYDQLGCNNSISSFSLDPGKIKELLLMITKDDVFANEMYEDIVKTIFNALELKEKKRLEKEKSVKGRGKGKGRGKKGKGKGDKKGKKDNKAEEIASKSVPAKAPSIPDIIELPPKPGELKWKYINLDQLPEIQVNLASFWEDIEEIYLNDFKQLFFLKRLCQNAVVPHVHDIFTHMIKFIERPDRMQDYLYQFQLIYNELENDLREDDEFKAEMHCRIIEFKVKLWDICAIKMRESEEERKRIINENWFYDQVATLLNLFTAALQLEIDLFFHTLNFLQDYYYAMTPEAFVDNKTPKTQLTYYKQIDKDALFVANAYIDMNLTVDQNPFVTYLNALLQDSLKSVQAFNSTATSNSKRIESLFSGKRKESKKKPAANEEQIDAIKDNLQSLMQEWHCAMEGEYFRVRYRINLLIAKAKCDVNELLLYGENLFHELFSRIDKRYHDELDSVSAACEIFAKGVEACEPIQPRLTFDGGHFYVESTQLLYEDPLKLEKEFKETITNNYFTITQLSNLADIFFDMAPRGSLPTKTFVYLFEDLIAHVTENNADSLLPYNWGQLQTDRVQAVITKIFGHVEYVNWKDFIIYSLELPFPTELELLTTRLQFREMDPNKLELVNQVQFNTVQFWFETDENILRHSYKKKLIRDLLIKMFKVRDELINYSALLLAFCKDTNPIVGVAKAFGLGMAKLICWDEPTGNNYLELLRYQRYLKDQDKMQSIQTAESICSDLIKSVVPDSSHLNTHVSTYENSYISAEDSIFSDEQSYKCEEMLPEEHVHLYMPEMCYILPFNVVLVILTAALPWHYRVQNLEDNALEETLEIIYENARNEEFDYVFAHEFLNSKEFKNYLNQNLKFVALSPAEIIKSEIEVCKCKKSDILKIN